MKGPGSKGPLVHPLVRTPAPSHTIVAISRTVIPKATAAAATIYLSGKIHCLNHNCLHNRAPRTRSAVGLDTPLPPKGVCELYVVPGFQGPAGSPQDAGCPGSSPPIHLAIPPCGLFCKVLSGIFRTKIIYIWEKCDSDIHKRRPHSRLCKRIRVRDKTHVGTPLLSKGCV